LATHGGSGRSGKRVAAWLAWEAQHAASLRSLQREIDRGASAGRRAQIENQRTKIYADAPTRDFAVSLCLRAWADLSTCRSIGMATGPIPWTSIIEWADFHELDREAAQILAHVIRQLDIERAEAAAAERAQDKALGANRARGRS
jgi:hypothetical protein